jgi:hypothetical protein
MVCDYLFYLSYEDIDKFLENIRNVKYKFLLITTHIVKKKIKNKDIISGDARFINLFIKPLNFKNVDVIDKVKDYQRI